MSKKIIPDCKRIDELIDDENKANTEYAKYAKENDDEDIKDMFEEMSEDESSHKKNLEKIKNTHCKTP